MPGSGHVPRAPVALILFAVVHTSLTEGRTTTMNAVRDLLADHWLAAVLLAVAFVSTPLVLLRRHRLAGWLTPLLALCAAPALLAVGGLALSKTWAWVLFATAGGVFFVLLLLLLITAGW